MPELNPQYAQFQKEIEQLLKELNEMLKRSNFTQVELAQLAAEIDFFEELRNLGFDELVTKYFNGYDKIIEEKLAQAERLNIKGLTGVDVNSLQLIRDLDTAYLLRSAEAWSAKYESELFKSIIRGDTIKETIENLEGIPLTDAQLGTVLNTQYSDFSRTTT